jgi:hypothetical protein
LETKRFQAIVPRFFIYRTGFSLLFLKFHLILETLRVNLTQLVQPHREVDDVAGAAHAGGAEAVHDVAVQVEFESKI